MESREIQILNALINDEEYTKTPQSRNEEILSSIINDEEYTKEPQSREEELLLELKDKIQNGGGGIVLIARSGSTESIKEE